MSPFDPHLDPDPDDLELASAYLDGATDAEERARVEASPLLRGLVTSMADVRQALSEPPAVGAEQRESALAAAMAHYATVDETAHPASASPAAQGATAGSRPGQLEDESTVRRLTPLRRIEARRGMWRVIGGAAAATIVVAIGIGVVRSGDGTQTARESTRTSSASPLATGAGPVPDGTVAAAAPAPSAPSSALSSPAAGGAESAALPMLGSLDRPTQLLTLPVPAGASRTGDQAPSLAAATSGVATAASGDLPFGAAATTAAASDSTAARSIGTIAAGTTAPAEDAAGSAGTNAAVPCLRPDDILLGGVVYAGVPAVAVLDPVAHVRRAVDATTCRVLAQVADPSTADTGAVVTSAAGTVSTP